MMLKKLRDISCHKMRPGLGDEVAQDLKWFFMHIFMVEQLSILPGKGSPAPLKAFASAYQKFETKESKKAESHSQHPGIFLAQVCCNKTGEVEEIKYIKYKESFGQLKAATLNAKVSAIIPSFLEALNRLQFEEKEHREALKKENTLTHF